MKSFRTSCYLTFLLLSPLLVRANSAQQTSGASDHTPLIAQAQMRSKLFAKQLQSELQTAIQQGGLSEGIKVCHQRAGEIAKDLSTDGWQMGRTALKVRNPQNQGDAWQTQVMQSFVRRHLQGENLVGMYSNKQNQETFSFMQAIPTAGVCLSCHGTNLSQEVSTVLQQYYPEDQATGFQLGELRGAFILTKTLK